MLKFSRYFFIVFLLITVLPLASMSLWHHSQMSHFMQNKEEFFLDIGYRQLEIFSKEYLKTKEEFVQRVVQNLPESGTTLTQYKNIFDADQVYIVNRDLKNKGNLQIPSILKDLNYNSINKITGYYDVLQGGADAKSRFVSVIVVPFANTQYEWLVVIDGVHVDKLYPHGPFNLEVYAGNKIQQSNLLEVIKNPFDPGFSRHRPEPPPFNPSFLRYGLPAPPPPTTFHNDFHNDSRYKVLKLNNYDGQTVVSLLLKNDLPPKPPFGRMGEQEPNFVIIIAGALLSLLFGFYIKKNFINPFLIISATSKKVKDGDLSCRVESDAKHPEVVETIKVFNDMISGLSEKQELRRSFITSLTHDLKTPLLAQERAVALMINELESLGLTEQFQFVKGIDKNSKHMLRMVDSILEAYRFDSNNINIIISNVDIYNLIEQCFSQMQYLALEKNISLINNVPKDFANIKADAASLKRVFINLIANAIDNMPNNSKVEISSNIVKYNIEIIVEDNGTGISPDDIEYIFDRYYTGKSDERKIGSGLGLYVCKNLIELHKGKIRVESEIGSFTRFIVTLPL